MSNLSFGLSLSLTFTMTEVVNGSADLAIVHQQKSLKTESEKFSSDLFQIGTYLKVYLNFLTSAYSGTKRRIVNLQFIPCWKFHDPP